MLFLLSSCLLPESPVWLVRMGRITRAEKNLRKVRGQLYDLEEEMIEIKRVFKADKGGNQSAREKLSMLFEHEAMMPLLLLATLFIIQVISR